MNHGFYHPARSPLHRWGAGVKMLALMGLCLGVFSINRMELILAVAVLVSALYPLARIPARVAFAQLRPALVLLLLIFFVQLVIIDWATALKVIVRFATLISVAALLTLTTRASAMLEALEQGLAPLKRLGVDTGGISLALSLAIRFIPIVASLASEVREAQRVRGLERSVFAVAVPTVMRTLQMADAIAEAIDARGYRPKQGCLRAKMPEQE